MAKSTLSSLLLFYARNAVVIHWKKPSAPSFTLWKQLVNNNLPLYKDACANRGYPKKYDRVWSKWLADTFTASEMNV